MFASPSALQLKFRAVRRKEVSMDFSTNDFTSAHAQPSPKQSLDLLSIHTQKGPTGMLEQRSIAAEEAQRERTPKSEKPLSDTETLRRPFLPHKSQAQRNAEYDQDRSGERMKNTIEAANLIAQNGTIGNTTEETALIEKLFKDAIERGDGAELRLARTINQLLQFKGAGYEVFIGNAPDSKRSSLILLNGQTVIDTELFDKPEPRLDPPGIIFY